MFLTHLIGQSKNWAINWWWAIKFYLTLRFPFIIYWYYIGTFWLISTARFSVHILPLHHYKSDLAHISDFDSFVIGLSKSERWAKIIKKRMTSSICTKFAHFWVVLVRKCMVQKFLISYRFDFFDRFFFRDFLIIPYELFHSFCSELNGQKWVCIVTITKW